MHLRFVLLLVHVDVVNLHILKHIDTSLVFNLLRYFAKAQISLFGIVAITTFLLNVVPVK